MEYITALGSGMLAGIGLAAPLGAIGVLLVREGLTHGFREAAPAAAAVALIDAGYCAVAVTVGGLAAPIVASWGRAPAVVGGAILVALGLHGMWRSRGTVEAGGRSSGPMPGLRRFGVFAGLTAVNPATLLYFAALTAGLGGLLRSFTGSLMFVAGVAVASLAWQLGLVVAGSLFRGRVTSKAQRTLSTLGNTLIVVLGLAAMVIPVQA